MHSLCPALDPPRLFTADLAFFQVGELPEVVHRVQVADLNEPSSHPLHHFPASLEATSPMGLPFQQVPGMKGVGSKLEKPTEAAGWGGWPE